MLMANGMMYKKQQLIIIEDVNKLGVVVQGQVYLNGESKPTIIENLTTNGMSVISIPSSDGTFIHCTFVNKFH